MKSRPPPFWNPLTAPVCRDFSNLVSLKLNLWRIWLLLVPISKKQNSITPTQEEVKQVDNILPNCLKCMLFKLRGFWQLWIKLTNCLDERNKEHFFMKKGLYSNFKFSPVFQSGKKNWPEFIPLVRFFFLPLEALSQPMHFFP